MRKKPAPYTKQKTTPGGSIRETKRTIGKEQRQTIEREGETIEKNNEHKAKSIDNKEKHQGNIIDKTVADMTNPRQQHRQEKDRQANNIDQHMKKKPSPWANP